MRTSQILKKIPTMTTEFGKPIESNFTKWIKGTFGDRTFSIYPGVYQNSDKFREFRYDLFRELEPKLPNDHEWSSCTPLLGEMGQASSHILLPFNDNAILRSQFNLRKVEEYDRTICEKLIRLVLQESSWDSFSVKDKSSSGFPYFIKGVGYKLSVVQNVFKRLPEIMRQVKSKSIDGVCAIQGNYPLFTLGVRYQLDKIIFEKGESKIAKERLAFSPDYVKSNGKKGEKVIIDYSVVNSNGFVDNRFKAARVRSMYALSYNYNCVLQALNNYLMNGLKKIAPEILFSTANDALGFLNRYGPREKVCIDYGNYGETIPGELVEIICAELETKMPGMGNYLRMTYNAPKLIRGWRKNVNEPFLSVDEIDYFSPVSSSLASGHGLVAFLGKFFAVLDAILIFKKLLNHFDLRNHLLNEYPSYTRLTSSDDGIASFADAKLEKDYRENISNLSLFKCEVTESPIYLGSVYLQNRVTRDLSKLLEHLTNFERSMNSKMFFELGMGCSIREYINNSYFPIVFPILVKHFKEINVDLNRYLDAADGIAEPTAIFLANPDSIFYKLDPKKVNSGIYKKFFFNVNVDNVTNVMKGLECV